MSLHEENLYFIIYLIVYQNHILIISIIELCSSVEPIYYILDLITRDSVTYWIIHHSRFESDISDESTCQLTRTNRNDSIFCSMSYEYRFFVIFSEVYIRYIDLREETTRECDDPTDELRRPPECIVGHDRSLAESHQIYLLWADIILLCYFSDICYDTLISAVNISRPIHGCTSSKIYWKPSIPPTS